METKVLIVEDEPITAKDISFLLQDIGINHTEMAMNYDEAVDILEETTFDLVLLDINLLSDQDGIDLAERINEKYSTPFIFITSYYTPSLVTRAKVTEPLAYLVKPFNKHDIQINVEMALYKSKIRQEDELLFFREQKGTISISQNEIIYLEADDNYTKIFFKDKHITVSQTLKAIHGKLVQKDFVRVHKSYCVRLQKISMIKGGFVYLDDRKVPIGRSYKEAFMAQIALL